MPRRLLLIGVNFTPEPTGIGKYSGEMIQWLADNGYECTVITSYPYYPQWKVQPPYEKNRYWFKKEVLGNITVYRCPQYIPSNPSGKNRIIMDFTFMLSVCCRLLRVLMLRKHDVVMSVVPPFHLGLPALLYKKLRGARLVYHIQDLQIEAAQDLGMIRSPWLIKQLFRLERHILKQADMISSISPGMISRIQRKASREIVSFPNWADISRFYPVENRDMLKSNFGFKTSDKIVLYSGAIGEKQGLEAILQTAETFREDEKVKFLICGSGPYKKRLQELAGKAGLRQVVFMDTQPNEVFNDFLNMADVHLIIQKANAGDLVMPSKLTTIMAVGGLAVITANAGTSLHEIVHTHNIGILAAAEDQQALNNSIHTAIYKDTGHITRNAREYALNYLAIDTIMKRFERSLVHGHVDTSR